MIVPALGFNQSGYFTECPNFVVVVNERSESSDSLLSWSGRSALHVTDLP